MAKRNTITVKNLETGRKMEVSPQFLAQQAKPYLGTKKVYENGVWVEAPRAPQSPESGKVISEAEKAANKAATAADPVDTAGADLTNKGDDQV